MYNVTDRYHTEYVTESFGKHRVMDRQTGETICELDSWQKADIEVKRLLRIESGIMNDDNIEIPFTYYPEKSREPMEVESVVVHK